MSSDLAAVGHRAHIVNADANPYRTELAGPTGIEPVSGVSPDPRVKSPMLYLIALCWN